MTSEGLLKEEEITLTYDVWTFNPSVLRHVSGDSEEILRFPDEVEDLFREEGYFIFARNMEVFESTKVNDKSAYISEGIQPVVIIAQLDEDYDEDYDDYTESEVVDDYHSLVTGGKVLFAGDGYLIFINNKECICRPVAE